MTRTGKAVVRSQFLSLVASKSFLLFSAIALSIWFIDPLVDSLFHHETEFSVHFSSPSPAVLLFRSFLSFVFLLTGIIVALKIRQSEDKNKQLQQQSAFMKQIIASEPECVKTVARDGTLLDMNPAGLNIIEADTLSEVQNNSVYDLISEEDRDAYKAFNERIFQGNQESMQYNLDGLKGSKKRVDSHAVPLRDDKGDVIAHLAITRDITEFTRSQQSLQQFSMAVEQCASMIMITDTSGEISYVNPKFCEVTGYSREETLGENPKILNSGHHDADFYNQLWQTISGGSEWRGRVQNRRKDGNLYWASVVISPIKNSTGEIIQFLCTQEDITSAHLLSKQLEYQSQHCMLTGLINRQPFETYLSNLIDEVKIDKSHHALFFCDIDQFKQINDSCGHSAGDLLLKQISHLFKENIREEDVVARLGGDEFAILITNCDQQRATDVAEHLRKAVEKFTFAWQEQNFNISISLGIVTIDQYSPDQSTVMSQADASCYIAKDQGRNRIYLHQDLDQDRLRQGEYQWVNKIHQGLEENRFKLYVQKIASLKDDATSHYEVLIRYQDEEGKIIPPGVFLPVAERYGISPKLDRWVIQEACQLLKDKLTDDIALAVNLSGLSMNDAGFLDYVTECIKQSAINPVRISFEITETATISNLSEAINFIKQMKQIGCRFALDDFGSGLSSFGYLRSLPVDTVKIDGIFVKNICNNKIDKAMVRSINEIGHLMGKTTIAEYVESLQAAQLLIELGVDYAQGYGISKPHPVEELYMPTV